MSQKPRTRFAGPVGNAAVEVQPMQATVEALLLAITTLEAQNRALLTRLVAVEALLRYAKEANVARAAETGALTYRLNKLPDMARLIGRVDALEGKHDAIGQSAYESGITIAERLGQLEKRMSDLEEREERKE